MVRLASSLITGQNLGSTAPVSYSTKKPNYKRKNDINLLTPSHGMSREFQQQKLSDSLNFERAARGSIFEPQSCPKAGLKKDTPFSAHKEKIPQFRNK
jgi:hypothetical protein